MSRRRYQEVSITAYFGHSCLIYVDQIVERATRRLLPEVSKGTSRNYRMRDHEAAVRAVPVKSGRLRRAVDRAYLNKYNTTGALKYAKDLAGAKSRATTTELVPHRIADDPGVGRL